MMNRPGKRSCTNFAGGHSDYEAKFGYSCNFKGTHETTPSCEEYKVKLSKRDDKDS